MGPVPRRTRPSCTTGQNQITNKENEVMAEECLTNRRREVSKKRSADGAPEPGEVDLAWAVLTWNRLCVSACLEQYFSLVTFGCLC